MANSNNVYGTVKPLEGNVSDWISGQEQKDSAYRQEQREIEEINRKRQAAEQLKKDKLKEKILGSIPKNYDTGSTSLNQFQARIIQKGVDRLGEIYKELNSTGLSETKRIDLELEAQNINNLPENLKVATDNFTKLISEYQKGKAENKYFSNPDFEKKVLSGFENYIGDLDNGLPVVAFADRNNDGTINSLDVVSYENLQQGIGPWVFQKQFDLDKMAVESAKNIGYTDITTDGNYKSVQEKKPKMSEIVTVADNLLQKPDGSPTEVALSQMKKMGLDNTPENQLKIKNYFVDRVIANTDYLKKEKTDYGAMTAAQRESRIARENKEKKENGKGNKNKASLSDLALTAGGYRAKVDKNDNEKILEKGPIHSSVYQGNVNISRKVGNSEEKFRSFSLGNDGNVKVTVDTSEKDIQSGASIIVPKVYNSEKDTDAVMFYAQRFKDPKTGKTIQTMDELKQKLSELGQAKQKETPAERALRIANGG